MLTAILRSKISLERLILTLIVCPLFNSKSIDYDKNNDNGEILEENVDHQVLAVDLRVLLVILRDNGAAQGEMQMRTESGCAQ